MILSKFTLFEAQKSQANLIEKLRLSIAEIIGVSSEIQ